MDMPVRRKYEELIARRVISDLLGAGFSISVNDGGETTLIRSRDAEAVFKAMFTTDEDFLYAVKDTDAPGDFSGWVRFIYGNDGYDVVSDYTTNLEPFMGGARELADALEAGEYVIIPTRKPVEGETRAAAVPCPCGHRACKDWMVYPLAAIQGVKFRQDQAEAVAALLNSMGKVW